MSMQMGVDVAASRSILFVAGTRKQNKAELQVLCADRVRIDIRVGGISSETFAPIDQLKLLIATRLKPLPKVFQAVIIPCCFQSINS